MRFALLLLASLGWSQEYFSVPPADAPLLAAWGPHQIGVKTLELIHKDQIDVLKFDKASGQAPKTDRHLLVEVWYPAQIPQGQKAHTVYESALRAGGGKLQVPGKALRDAAPLGNGQRFPLVIVSHGYPGTRTFLSYLSENIASKGYIVAAIDHTDSVLGDIKPFPSTLLNRSADQLFTIGEIIARLSDIVDADRVAIIGYSMGGYGALTSGGAGYSKAGAPAKMIPGGYLDAWTAGDPAYAAQMASLQGKLKGIVAIAPWGMQPPMQSWDAEGLKGIRVPALFIVGDQDDVSGYEKGVKPAFESAVNSERCLLVYENARHNVGGNPRPPGVDLDSSNREFFDEPVWRKDRLNAINQHFVTAFLDTYVKGDATRKSFLQVQPQRANDGVWEVKPGENVAGKFSEGGNYWKGFQRRWALGMRMDCRPAAR